MRAGDRPPCDLDLGKPGPAREVLDGVAVSVAGREVHFRDARPLSKLLLDQADRLEELGPVHGGDEPHARDHVADRHVRGDLLVVLEPHDLVGSEPLSFDPLHQPRETGTLLRIALPQALQEMNGEGGRQRLPLESPQPGFPRFPRFGADAQKRIGESIRLFAGEPASDDPVGQTAQVLDQHEP